MPAFIDRDCQAIYLGHIRRDDLVRAVGRLARHEHMPTKLTDNQKSEIRDDPRFVALRQRRELCVKKIKDGLGFPTVKAAKGETEWWQRYKDVDDEIKSLMRQLSDARLKQAIQEFHDTVDTIVVDQQLRGSMPPAEALIPSAIEYELTSRATAANLLFTSLENLTESQVLRVRVKLIQALAQLCKQQETPHQFKTSTSRTLQRAPRGKALLKPFELLQINDVLVTTGDSSNIAAVVRELSEDTGLNCPFCKCDEEAGPRKRNHIFSRIDALRRHVRKEHLEHRDPNTGLHCPFIDCMDILGGNMHFLNHTARQHGLYL